MVIFDVFLQCVKTSLNKHKLKWGGEGEREGGEEGRRGGEKEGRRERRREGG